jgi:MoaA/NifB/PqqE/SkfB family radical SAM enzyme
MRKIFIVTDYSCNNACISCAKKLEEKGRLELEQLINEIDLIKPSKEDFIEVSGGEPTLREDLFKLYEHIKSNYDTNLIILSNGRRFKDKNFSKKIKDSGVDRVMTTFYSPHEQVHDEITMKKGSFADSVDGLRNLEEMGLPISVKTIILEQNYKDLSDFVSFSYDTFPSAWVSIHGLILRGHASDNRNQITPRYKNIKPYVEEALDEAIKRDKNLGVFIIPSCIIDPSYWQYLSVNWKKMSKEMVYISPEHIIHGNLDIALPNYCSDCLINENCSWAWESAWKEYIDMFGTGELSKVTPSKLRFE